MGTVRSRFWRGERVWFIDYIAADGRRVRRTIGPGEQNRRYAKQILLQREAEATLGRNHIPVSRTVRFAEFARDWLKRIASRVKPKTLETYENALQRHLLPRFGEMRLGALSRREVESYVLEKIAAGTRRGKKGKAVPLAPATINKTLAVLKLVLHDAIEHGLLTESAALRVKLVRDISREKDEQLNVLPPAEIERLLAVAEEPYRGLNRSEEHTNSSHTV